MSQKQYWERDGLSKRRHPSHPVVAAYVLPKISEIRKHLVLDKGTRLLDVGCGNGFFTYHLDPICDVRGVDFSTRMLALNPVRKTCLMDAARLGFADGSFDVVLCHALLHHAGGIDGIVSEMRRVSRKYVVVLEPNRNNPLMFLFALWKREERGALRFSMPFLKGVVERNGLRVLAAFSHGMIVPNKTPAFLLPLLRLMDFRQPLGMTSVVIAEKAG